MIKIPTHKGRWGRAVRNRFRYMFASAIVLAMLSLGHEDWGTWQSDLWWGL